MGAPTGVASVAAQLLAFYREPALHRPAYLHGSAPMPDGQAVLRLALGRFAECGLPQAPARERGKLREAARAFVRQACLWERATHYQVLCLEPGATQEAIKECYHLLIALIHPDRQDAAAEAWPAGCAQRANQAYEVLGDAVLRARYDEQLLQARAGAALEAAARAARPADSGAARRQGARGPESSVLKRFAVVGGVIAALFVVQAWWVGDVAPEYALLERAVPSSSRWVRDALPDPPRFLGGSAASVAFEPGARLDPLPEPRRIAALGPWIPVREPPPRAEARSLAPSPPASVSQPAAGGPATSVPAQPAEPVLRLAQVVPSPARAAQAVSASPRIAQADTAPAASGPSREQVEALVALLVGYYDAGDAERLVDLHDPDRLGWWSGYRLRSAYADFFGATRERRLRMDHLAWQVSGATVQARGEATVTAEYHDGRPRLERRVPVAVDIGLRDGRARIARLVLFPGGQ